MSFKRKKEKRKGCTYMSDIFKNPKKIPFAFLIPIAYGLPAIAKSMYLAISLKFFQKYHHPSTCYAIVFTYFPLYHVLIHPNY